MGLRGKGDEHDTPVDVGPEDAAAEDVDRVADIEPNRAASGDKLQFANHIRVNELKVRTRPIEDPVVAHNILRGNKPTEARPRG